MTGSDGFLDGISYDDAPRREEETGRQVSQDRLASALVRRTAMRHDQYCRSQCAHRNHRRDQSHLALLLDALGLADEPVRAEDYEVKLVWHAATRGELKAMAGIGSN